MQNIWTTRYDHILSEIESGRMAAAVATLSGMFDMAASRPDLVEGCRSALGEHPLNVALAAPIAREAIAELGFARASLARAMLVTTALEASRIADQTSILLEDLDCALPNGPVDLIIAPRLADAHCTSSLPEIVRQVTSCLTAQGRLILSAFTPNHLGYGWRSICEGEEVHCHDEAGFSALARTVQLSPAIYRDGSGNLIWAEFSRLPHNENKGKENGYCDPYSGNRRRRPVGFHTALSPPAEGNADLCSGTIGGRP